MMTFAEADAQYELVKQRYQSGGLNDEQYDDQLRSLMVLDDQGRWWAKSRENGGWHYFDPATNNWLSGVPPIAPPAAPLPRQGNAAAAAADRSAVSAASPSSTAGAGQEGLPKWAAVAPPSVQQPKSTAKSGGPLAVGPNSQPAGSPAPGAYSARDFGPISELSGSLKVIFYVLSLLIPVFGFVLFFVYRKKPAQADRSAARVFLILGVVSLVFSCIAGASVVLLESVILGAGL